MDWRKLAGFQGAYFALTGIWPLFDIDSFMAVTGPKTDLWLVRTVGILVTVIGATLLAGARRGRAREELALLAISSAAGLAAIDILYSTLGVISKIYLADAVLELALVGAWTLSMVRARAGVKIAG
jgi:hypothetical protein